VEHRTGFFVADSMVVLTPGGPSLPGQIMRVSPEIRFLARRNSSLVIHGQEETQNRKVPPANSCEKVNTYGKIRKNLYICREFGASKNVLEGRLVDIRILVVDDSKTTRRVLSALVSSRWTVCAEAENGNSGVQKFRELKPDLVLLDLAMPDIDGIEAGRRMHAIDPSVPLILFTLLDPGGGSKVPLAERASAK
jgi:Response regulator receiver domain